ncbi:MAG: glucose-1-phosphate thymidylyltransferase RfbA [Clostridia bacterium]|nr:glucose-1-phosphate thymidylyltransferase RfbA [Clostridia bacterium]
MKGIILAAGKGTRLYPATTPICKPLVTVYDKPLIYYPLSLLLMAGIKDILIITPPDDTEPFARCFGEGSALGIHITYKEQKVQCGIADAFRIGKDFIGNDSVCLALADNIFYHKDFATLLQQARSDETGAAVFGYYVDNPQAFGVVEFDASGKAISIEEKPAHPKSNYIIPGLYFYDNQVIAIAENLQPSARGELEITDVNIEYLQKGQLRVVPMGKDVQWLDAGSSDSLLDASNIIKEIQNTTGHYVGCIEEEAYKQGYISKEDVHAIGQDHNKTNYGQYLLSL